MWQFFQERVLAAVPWFTQPITSKLGFLLIKKLSNSLSSQSSSAIIIFNGVSNVIIILFLFKNTKDVSYNFIEFHKKFIKFRDVINFIEESLRTL